MYLGFNTYKIYKKKYIDRLDVKAFLNTLKNLILGWKVLAHL